MKVAGIIREALTGSHKAGPSTGNKHGSIYRLWGLVFRRSEGWIFDRGELTQIGVYIKSFNTSGEIFIECFLFYFYR